jgi:hypothetical protein
VLDDEQIKLAEFYFLDGMFGDALLKIPKKTYKTLQEAIAKHDKDFGDSLNERVRMLRMCHRTSNSR